MHNSVKFQYFQRLRTSTLTALVVCSLAFPVEVHSEDQVPTPKAKPMPLGGLPGIGGQSVGSPASKPKLPTPKTKSTDSSDSTGDDDSSSSSDSDDDSDGTEASSGIPSSGAAFSSPRQKPPILDPNAKVTLDFVNKPLLDLIKYMAEITGRNFILTDDIKGDVTIISHKPVSVPAAYEAFLSAMEVSGWTTVTVGNVTKVVKSNEAAKTPIRVHHGGNIPFTDNFVTQIIELENVSVTDISSVVNDLKSKDGSVIAYAPANTLILTDAATNIRKIYRIINQLDIAAPKAKMHMVTLANAEASAIQVIIQDLYGTAKSSSSASSSDDKRAARRRRLRDRKGGASNKGGSSTSVGAEGKYIEKIIADERTNSLIIMANDEAMAAVLELINELDVDVDPSSRAQIHVVYLENAKAEDIANVLSNLSDGSSSSRGGARGSGPRSRRTATATQPSVGGNSRAPAGAKKATDGGGSATAAFQDGVRITSDENTNSLVIIATQDQFSILKQVIERLDIRRMQVFVEAVILEIGSTDMRDAGLGFHMGIDDLGDGGAGMVASGSGSLQMDPTAFTQGGLNLAYAGKTVPVSAQVMGETVELDIPAFGIALQALQENSAVNILSTPNILTMDNEEAKIIVGKNVPFQSGSSLSGTGMSSMSISREDVGLTLKVTPQINESRFVTLEVFQEVQEIESIDETKGPTTTKRSAETTVVVRDNQTVVIGGLIGTTESETEKKIPILGDIPLIGMLFRKSTTLSTKTNMMIFLTPHIIEGPEDLEEVYRVKWLQRQEFIKRFYGKSRAEGEAAMQEMLQYSINQIDKPSVYRTKSDVTSSEGGFTTIGSEQTNQNPVEIKELGTDSVEDVGGEILEPATGQ